MAATCAPPVNAVSSTAGRLRAELADGRAVHGDAPLGHQLFACAAEATPACDKIFWRRSMTSVTGITKDEDHEAHEESGLSNGLRVFRVLRDFVMKACANAQDVPQKSAEETRRWWGLCSTVVCVMSPLRRSRTGACPRRSSAECSDSMVGITLSSTHGAETPEPGLGRMRHRQPGIPASQNGSSFAPRCITSRSFMYAQAWPTAREALRQLAQPHELAGGGVVIHAVEGRSTRNSCTTVLSHRLTARHQSVCDAQQDDRDAVVVRRADKRLALAAELSRVWLSACAQISQHARQVVVSAERDSEGDLVSNLRTTGRHESQPTAEADAYHSDTAIASRTEGIVVIQRAVASMPSVSRGVISNVERPGISGVTTAMPDAASWRAS